MLVVVGVVVGIVVVVVVVVVVAVAAHLFQLAPLLETAFPARVQDVIHNLFVTMGELGR